MGLAFDFSGNMFIADYGNNKIRKVATNGIITTIAGTGAFGDAGDSGPATSAEMANPDALTFDTSGNLYVAEDSGPVVRKIATNGTISTFAGTAGSWGFAGDGGAATSATLRNPQALVFDAIGNLYIAMGSGAEVRKVATNGTISTVAGTTVAGSSGDGGAATSAQLNGPDGLAIDREGNLYVSDWNNSVIRKIALIAPATGSVTVTANIDPAMTFTVGSHAGACNGATQTAGTTAGATTVGLGHPTAVANAVSAQDIGVTTNAANGFTVYTRSAGAMSDGNGHTISAVSGSNATPGAFPGAGTAAFGYTTNSSALGTGTGNRFTSGGPKWAAFTTTNAEVSYAATGYVSQTNCVGYQIGAAATTVAGAYAVTVTYTAVPSF
jgi:hypothetical protein